LVIKGFSIVDARYNHEVYMICLFPIRKIACKPTLKAKEIKEELAAYFLSGGRVE